MLVVPATGEAEAGELLVPGRRRLQRAKIVSLHSSLGDRVRLCLKIQKQKQKKRKEGSKGRREGDRPERKTKRERKKTRKKEKKDRKNERMNWLASNLRH